MQASIYALLEDLFEMPTGSLTGAESLTDLPTWSSLTFVALIAMVDEEFEVTLAPKDVMACGDVKALAALIERDIATSQAA